MSFEPSVGATSSAKGRYILGRISKIGFARFESKDVARLSAYYRDVLGLTIVERADGATILTCPLDHHSIMIEEGSRNTCTEIGLETTSESDLAVIEKKLQTAGVDVRSASDPAQLTSRRISFRVPGEFSVCVDLVKPASGGIAEIGTVGPRKLGHIAFKVVDVHSATKFFVDFLDFRVSDWIGDFFSFMRCGPDHHTVNLLRSDENQLMHHIAFELTDMDHLQCACDTLSRSDLPVIWGPGRHGPGHNVFTYHHNPDGQIVELFTQLDQMNDENSGAFDPRPWHEDKPQRPKTWEPGPRTSNSWGMARPPEFMR